MTSDTLSDEDPVDGTRHITVGTCIEWPWYLSVKLSCSQTGQAGAVDAAINQGLEKLEGQQEEACAALTARWWEAGVPEWERPPFRFMARDSMAASATVALDAGLLTVTVDRVGGRFFRCLFGECRSDALPDALEQLQAALHYRVAETGPGFELHRRS